MAALKCETLLMLLAGLSLCRLAAAQTPISILDVPGDQIAFPLQDDQPVFLDILYESLPYYIKLKFKLIDWFEDHDHCPNKAGQIPWQGFPAWLGWKSTMDAAPAITTPPLHLAGNRSMAVEGFCPIGGVKSSWFTCVSAESEIKLRLSLERVRADGDSPIAMDLDKLTCTLKDISLYKINSHPNQVFMRFDFAPCSGNVQTGALRPHVPRTTAMNMYLSPPVADEPDNNFANFFNAVCNGGPPASWNTQALPMYPKIDPAGSPVDPTSNAPRCWADSTNAAHVLGKGCFDDFMFFENQITPGTYAPPMLARIPTKDFDKILDQIPGYQTMWQPTYENNTLPDPCAPIAPPKPGPNPCDTTTTTTTTRLVPGVVIADRICLRFPGCACNNECDCKENPFGSTTTATTTSLIPPGWCQECWFVLSIVGFFAFILAFNITTCMWENCFRVKRKEVASSSDTWTKGSINASEIDGARTKWTTAPGGKDEWYSQGVKGQGVEFTTYWSIVVFYKNLLADAFNCLIVSHICVVLVFWIWKTIVKEWMPFLIDDIIYDCISWECAWGALVPIWLGIFFALLMGHWWYFYFKIEVEKATITRTVMVAGVEGGSSGGGSWTGGGGGCSIQ